MPFFKKFSFSKLICGAKENEMVLDPIVCHVVEAKVTNFVYIKKLTMFLSNSDFALLFFL